MVSSLSCALRNPFLQSLLHFSQPYSKPFPLSVLQAICAPLRKNTEKGHSKKPEQRKPTRCGPAQFSCLLSSKQPVCLKIEAIRPWAKFLVSVFPFHPGLYC